MEMVTRYRRRQWRDRKPVTIEDLHMSHQAMGVLCALAAIGTALIILLIAFGQPFINALFGG
ncbi:hypothetical protein H3V53_06175 [Paraburkholderia bengalensis]|uniref:Uncharacterized protein n=1 Tax=Paraburkholderia bengalensis TaxID=2747562 RepID=A0ABU8IMH6_9BURK